MTVTLQKQVSRRVGKKEYMKWVVVIPSQAIEETGMIEGQKLYLTTDIDEYEGISFLILTGKFSAKEMLQ